MREGVRLKRESKLDTRPIGCSAERCLLPATIFHRSKPYCGKHALALLDAGDRPDRAEDFREDITSASPGEQASRRN